MRRNKITFYFYLFTLIQSKDKPTGGSNISMIILLHLAAVKNKKIVNISLAAKLSSFQLNNFKVKINVGIELRVQFQER